MSHEDLRDIICRVIKNMTEAENAPARACMFADECPDKCDVCDLCDVTPKYAAPTPS